MMHELSPIDRASRVGVFRQKSEPANKSPRRRRLHDQTVEGAPSGVTATITRLNEADPP